MEQLKFPWLYIKVFFNDFVYTVNWDVGFVRDFMDEIHINAYNIFSFQLVTNYLLPNINVTGYQNLDI